MRPDEFAMVGVGDVDWLTAPRFTRLLDNLAASPAAFRLARLSGVLNSGQRDGITPGSGGIVWPHPDAPMDFSATFAGLAALTSRGLTPFVSLGFFPTAVSPSPIAPPPAFDGWQRLVRAFFAALASDPRFGPTLKDWWFEVWNEPNQDRFWTGSFDQYLALYRATVQAVRATRLPIRLGGPAISYKPAGAPDAGKPAMDAFLHFLGNEPDMQCDFVSLHRKGTFGAEPPDLETLGAAVAETAQLMASIGPRRFAGIPIVNDEADMKVGFEVPYAPRMDERFAAWETAAMIVADGLSARFQASGTRVWADADDAAQQLIEAPFDGRRSIMTRTSVAADDLLKLPVYGFYELLRLLGDRHGSILTGDAACYPHSDLFHLITAGDDQLCALFAVYPRTGNETPRGWTVDFMLRDIPWPRVNIARFRIDGTHTNAFAAVGRRLDAPVSPATGARLRQIQELAVDAPIRRGVAIRTGTLHDVFTIPPFGVLAYWVTPFRPDPPAAPGWLVTSPADGNVILRWQPVTDPALYTYEVYLMRDGMPAARLSPLPLRSALWVDTAPPRGPRVYGVRAVSASGVASALVISAPAGV